MQQLELYSKNQRGVLKQGNINTRLSWYNTLSLVYPGNKKTYGFILKIYIYLSVSDHIKANITQNMSEDKAGILTGLCFWVSLALRVSSKSFNLYYEVYVKWGQKLQQKTFLKHLEHVGVRWQKCKHDTRVRRSAKNQEKMNIRAWLTSVMSGVRF